MLSPNEVAKEVSKLLAKENICFVDKTKRSITTIAIADLEKEETAKQVAKMEEKADQFVKLVPMPKQKLLFVMQDFLLEVTDQDIKKELGNGLRRKKPTRNFLQIVESRIDINQHWTLYHAEQYELYVRDQLIAAYNY